MQKRAEVDELDPRLPSTDIEFDVGGELQTLLVRGALGRLHSPIVMPSESPFCRSYSGQVCPRYFALTDRLSWPCGRCAPVLFLRHDADTALRMLRSPRRV